jgi:hypothetical protein
MTDTAYAGALVRSICTLAPSDFEAVRRRLEDPSHARMSGGATWSIFKALDTMDRAEQQELLSMITSARTP